jgi:leucine dehydrogenase
VTLDSVFDGWDGEQVVVAPPDGDDTWIFVGMHSTRRGPAAGGTRIKTYATREDALGDALALATAMTAKMAVHDVPLGGGKAVLAVPEVPVGDARLRLLRRLADVIESLGGRFATGPDMNTSAADMDALGEWTEHVFCRSADHGGSGDPSPSTAHGVYHGIRASVAHALGSDDLRGRTIAVQGVGNVGATLAELLSADGATVLLADVDAGRAAAVAGRAGAQVVSPEEVLALECDVVAPCAAGGVIDDALVEQRLRCRVVAGAANNPLTSDAVADALREAGILYAPDFVINGGGALHGAGLELLGWDRETLDRRLAGIGETLTELYRRADAERTTTLAAARALAAANAG